MDMDKELLKLAEENKHLISEVVFLTKQVSDRDKFIQELQILSEVSYEQKNNLQKIHEARTLRALKNLKTKSKS